MEGRWFKRADGIIFRMDDPDHIKRMLGEGWHEVNMVDSPAAEPPAIETPEDIQARNAAARAAFSPAPPAAGPALKPIRKTSERGDAHR